MRDSRLSKIYLICESSELLAFQRAFKIAINAIRRSKEPFSKFRDLFASIVNIIRFLLEYQTEEERC